MKRAAMSNSKPDCQHSEKNCTCGGHSANDVKKNKHHHSTKKKLEYRQLRRFFARLFYIT